MPAYVAAQEWVGALRYTRECGGIITAWGPSSRRRRSDARAGSRPAAGRPASSAMPCACSAVVGTGVRARQALRCCGSSASAKQAAGVSFSRGGHLQLCQAPPRHCRWHPCWDRRDCTAGAGGEGPRRARSPQAPGAGRIWPQPRTRRAAVPAGAPPCAGLCMSWQGTGRLRGQ